MLLKIFTNQNSIKIIDKIEDAEIRGGQWRFDDRNQLKDCITYGPGVFTETGYTPNETICYDATCYATPTGENGQSEDVISSSVVKLVDYKKAGQWHRVAICQYAYLCNDDGKTISKID